MPGRLEDLAARKAPTVLTPHAGELGRLLEIDSDAVGARRLFHARDAARRSQAVVLLKGDDTLVADARGRGRRQPRRLAGAGHRRHRRRALGRDRRAAGQGHAAVPRRLRGDWLHADARARWRRSVLGAEVVIARDVIEALPEARRRR